MKQKIIDWIFPIIFGVIVFFLMFFFSNPFKQDSVSNIMKSLSDDFTLPGVLLVGWWGLSLSSNKGVFDGLSFSGRIILRNIIPIDVFKKDTMDGYQHYKHIKEQKRKPVHYHDLIVGAGFLIFALIFCILFNSL